ncbi:pilus assembly FimT family protein [Candidatus Laterigemmans baculatus]|uniref:pilus assembly FimT family protein n=1 Tax=Candidatus Laterigemmans baculatus TaxID=2770505 RepID=UPI0013DAAFDF|nr:prepilin-type N-terminal cleavage/methylation domain-containing protein [Candidatus Laterigemmans baculatus]
MADRRSPRGFTLLELLLALAVMVALGAVAIPGIFGVLANRQLARGGSGLRVAMVQARLEAMRTGRTQVMRFELGGSRYQVVPHYDPSDMTEAADMMGQGTAVATGGVAIPVVPSPAMQGGSATAPPPTGQGSPRDMLSVSSSSDQLPDQVLFSDAQVQATARSSTLNPAAGMGVPASPVLPAAAGGLSSGTSGNWSQPILFYADGTTSTAVVTLSRESVGHVVVRLRGLTGEPTVSEIVP